MAALCPIGFDVTRLRQQVLATYDRVAREPEGDFHFHRGPFYAVDSLGYSAADVDAVPLRSTMRFAGVGNPLAIGAIREGEVVLDHACGAGMDLLIAARRVGPAGRAIGVDMTPAMRRCAESSAKEAGLAARVSILGGFYESLPIGDETIDVVISNGVLNLAPDKQRVLGEIARVLKPGGRLYLADVVVQREVTLTARIDPDLWAACVAGAVPESELPELVASVGLEAGHVTHRFDSFRGTSAEHKVSSDLRIQALNFFACKRSARC